MKKLLLATTLIATSTAAFAANWEDLRDASLATADLTSQGFTIEGTPHYFEVRNGNTTCKVNLTGDLSADMDAYRAYAHDDYVLVTVEEGSVVEHCSQVISEGGAFNDSMNFDDAANDMENGAVIVVQFEGGKKRVLKADGNIYRAYRATDEGYARSSFGFGTANGWSHGSTNAYDVTDYYSAKGWTIVDVK